jgi:hypothetical protein
LATWFTNEYEFVTIGVKEHEVNTDAVKVGELFFLLHPGEVEFSGYGLTVERGSISPLVGILMVDRPQPASSAWLKRVQKQFGRYELVSMTKTDERGIVCQMHIADDSLAHVRPLAGMFTRALQVALFPFLLIRPKPQLLVSWDAQTRVWRSELYQPKAEQDGVAQTHVMPTPRFALGQVVATPGALAALEEAGQLPQEFLHRHVRGDWGELDPHDVQANEHAVNGEDRIFSAYSTKKGTRLWVITEWDRSVTTLLLPSDY